MKGYHFLKTIQTIEAHEGKFWIADCFPWEIKAGCTRLDCPMRTLAIPLIDDQEGAAALECNPVGNLADVLLALQTFEGS